MLLAFLVITGLFFVIIGLHLLYAAFVICGIIDKIYSTIIGILVITLGVLLLNSYIVLSVF